ncbi:aminotransferase class V-fold PLP-dependent enzyme [Pedobacter sp. JCM 36344]|uniref:aminotransferase class V-fold PLP-dependent enzyme n=1 Tax=Pedobacter sp. JCM 36344 TaxID=3374280 RepID=UPI00397D6A57
MNFTDQFPLLEKYTYLDTASSGLLSQRQVNWRRVHDQTFFEQGSLFRLTQAAFLHDVKATIAKFFNAKTENSFLIPNFSFGFNTLLEGLPGGQRFLLLTEDYPSVNYAIETRGHTCEYITMAEQLEERIIDHIKTQKPTVFAFSLVQYVTGVKLSLEFVKDLKALFPDLLIIADGTQFCGTTAFDFEASGFDVFMASGYKWMLAGYGNGFMFLKDEIASRLFTEARKRPSPTEQFLQSKSLLSVYFEPGHLDTLNFGTLKQSILYFEELGMGLISQQTQSLSEKAKAAFTERGLLTKFVAQRKDHSTIFNLALSIEKYQKLLAADIICYPRGSGIRLAFHFFNTEADLAKLLDVLSN